MIKYNERIIERLNRMKEQWEDQIEWKEQWEDQIERKEIMGGSNITKEQWED